MRRLRRLYALSPSERRIVVEAVLLTILISAALRLAPFRVVLRIVRGHGAPMRSGRADGTPRIAALVRATTTALGSRCLVSALVLLIVLSRRHIASELVIGAALRDGGFGAHAWLCCDGEVVLGSGDAREYTAMYRVASHPAT
jgi:hypothetical protein